MFKNIECVWLKNMKVIRLLKKSTWRCGKLQRNIVNFIIKKSQQPIVRPTTYEDIYRNIPATSHDEINDALKRLQARAIIAII